MPAGTDLIGVGDAPSGVFVVLDGFACRYALRASGARQIIALLVPGDLCDLGATLSRRMDHAVGTLPPCRVAQLTPAGFARLLQRPALSRALAGGRPGSRGHRRVNRALLGLREDGRYDQIFARWFGPEVGETQGR